jgi:ABC-type sugar transport system ATPase subunit
VKDFCLTIRAGEVVGLGGMMGSGRTEFARLLVGLAKPTAGTIHIEGKRTRIRSMKEARSLGIAYVPEDRQKEGLALVLATGINAIGPSMTALSPTGFVQRRRARQLAAKVLEESDVRPRGDKVIAGRLSGGNQQKLVLGKWLPTAPKLLVLDEPTRGVDIQARSQIHQRIDALARQGAAILLISSELPELLTVSDRIVVMREGRLMGLVDPTNWTEESVIGLATGHRGEVSQ